MTFRRQITVMNKIRKRQQEPIFLGRLIGLTKLSMSVVTKSSEKYSYGCLTLFKNLSA